MFWKFLKRGSQSGAEAEKPAQADFRGNGNRNRGRAGQSGSPRIDKMILSERVQIERKQFFFDFKENAGGRFLRITEDVSGHRDTIIVPATGLQLFRESLEHVIAADAREQA